MVTLLNEALHINCIGDSGWGLGRMLAKVWPRLVRKYSLSCFSFQVRWLFQKNLQDSHLTKKAYTNWPFTILISFPPWFFWLARRQTPAKPPVGGPRFYTIDMPLSSIEMKPMPTLPKQSAVRVCPGPMFSSFSAWMGTGVSNMAGPMAHSTL